MKQIQYAMTSEYRKEWGPIEAVKEIVQNCLDNTEDNSTFQVSMDGTITITTEEYILPMSTFALGESQNKNETTIGGFGEGFKLAMMVLLRSKCDPYIMFGSKLATCVFHHDQELERDLFSIIVRDHYCEESKESIHYDETTFIIAFPFELIEELKLKVNVFAESPMQEPGHKGVAILPDRPGEIFVNGLFVCNVEKFKYGYNFSPSRIHLGCDRQIANPLGLAWETSQVWADTFDDPQEVLQMMTDEQLDVQDLHYFISKSNATELTKAFSERYGNVTIKPMGSSLSYGMSVGGNLYSSMTKSDKISVANHWEEKGTPYLLMKEFFRSERKHMRRHAIAAFEGILEKSKVWKKKL